MNQTLMYMYVHCPYMKIIYKYGVNKSGLRIDKDIVSVHANNSMVVSNLRNELINFLHISLVLQIRPSSTQPLT